VTSTGLIVAGAVLVLGTAAGLWRRRTDGRLRSVAKAGSAAAPVGSSAAMSDSSAPNVASPSGAVPNAAVPNAAVPNAAAPNAAAPNAAAPGDAAPRVDAELLAALGVGPARATLLQFSSAFCAPCRALRRVGSEVAQVLPGVQHIEVDAESHLDAVRALGIWRTPTLLVLDADGRVAKRATGVPAKPQLIAVLGEILPAVRLGAAAQGDVESLPGR
jgi:thiol-disulfide isomerase/thioredoxin